MDPFKKTALCANTHIPIYANHTISYEHNFENTVSLMFYGRPKFDSGCIRKANTLKNLKTALERYIGPARIPIGGKNYFFMKGAMYTEEGIPLMVLAMPQKAFKDPNIKKFSDFRYDQEVNPVDYKNFVLFYSTSFFTNPSYAALNRRFQKEILMDCYIKGIEVKVITSSEIEKNTFASLFEIPKANSVSQLEEYMSTVLPTYLYTEEEDTFVFKELEVPQAQEEELSLEEEALLFDSESSPTLEQVLSDSAHTEHTYFVGVDPAFSTSMPFTSLTTGDFHFVDQPNISIGYPAGEIITAEGTSWIYTGRDERPIELIDDEV
jgi:hypothetical protein